MGLEKDKLGQKEAWLAELCEVVKQETVRLMRPTIGKSAIGKAVKEAKDKGDAYVSFVLLANCLLCTLTLCMCRGSIFGPCMGSILSAPPFHPMLPSGTPMESRSSLGPLLR